MSKETVSTPFFDPKNRRDQVTSIFFRLDQQDDALLELKVDMQTIKKVVYEIRLQYKVLLSLGSMLLIIGTILGWLLSNKYLIIQLPH
jgi:hypothetical protein